jgi:hypothetical protein
VSEPYNLSCTDLTNLVIQLSMNLSKVTTTRLFRRLPRTHKGICRFLPSPASVPARKLCYLNCLDHAHVMHRNHGVAHAGIYCGVYKPCQGLLVHCLQNEPLRDGAQDQLLLCLEGDDEFGCPTCVDDVPSLAVSCGHVGCDLQGGFAEQAECNCVVVALLLFCQVAHGAAPRLRRHLDDLELA